MPLKRFVLSLACLLASVSTVARAAGYDLDGLGVPKFVDTNYIDLTKIFQLSKFRSSAGHDYSDDLEKCRSMKHYFMKPDATVAIWSPVAGTVSALRDEFVGTQVQITADVQPAFTFVIFHVALAKPLIVGEHVTEGQRLGNHGGLETYSDIAVAVNAANGYRLVSYFETLTDAAFAAFKSRGIASPSQLIISKAERDAAPYACSGQAFSNLTVNADAEYVTLTGGAPPTASSAVAGPITSQTVTLFLSPPANVANLTGGVFVAAQLPPEMGSGIYLMTDTTGWIPYTTCSSAPAVQQGRLYAGIGVYPVTTPLDLSALKGTTLYVGYGIGATVAGACHNMVNSMTIAPAYTIN